ncbi:D-glycero-beta-D-manno-heptose 1,7-bisphosphate 7-phosphatase [Campylobacter pinnipediorum]|uniref:D,D-heptose 1,7-bisphosphate phosphatase n=1 Tax=Campylobacter pinnipediorum subsp. caledonicus TaxID=1874362 RepID=A0A1S6U7N2_9BACT|nr:D-glycero-beta-D-manno-heptose 1,7-bisphosphate 7-phosphatase [Campylobacter pinnipediorum]AQW82782.1 D,D-heptose 1,7-bisphosphate phosphatase [Campylobacter pinnipediorum subsp. pinnipediorum]AQW84469.1 D,D-heptose 1,7-bisphosphate phosphatase [Campylobacter pinnipediorum subsp. pinnipediorum]AQW86082.1 D,D-heptose 1,7-bisphosphate phosphatase [Campylobacter pinnipediorum subsp. caledonicus]AQW87689.1 D,D-heptose 1,7-bisphosphate phosphatase [Campylobacter pinnipediorum subsp. caledonicus]
MNKNKAIFLDRDGVINVDFGYVYKPENFVFCDGIFEALKGFISFGYKLIIITNQSGIQRGYYTLQDFENITNFMIKKLKNEGICIQKVFFCPHSPEQMCDCRKPSPKMILDASSEFNISLKDSIMIGDKKSDILAGKNAGVGLNFLIDNINFKNAKDVFDFLKDKENL